MSLRTYNEMIRHSDFEGRFLYLKLRGGIGRETFGFDREINQRFYRSREWKRARDYVIVRDEGCDLGVEGYEIHGELLVHHMNPMTPDDIVHGDPDILDPRFLITTTQSTHNAIHFGDTNHIPNQLVERRPGDTTPW